MSVEMSAENWTKWEPVETPLFPQLSFEKIDPNYWYSFAERHPLLQTQIVAIYLIALYALHNFYMKNRKPLEIRPILFVWNLSMGLFSLLAFYRMSVELSVVLSWENGFYKSLCVREGLHMTSLFWGLAYIWSKVLFLTDTFFIVLRKRPIQPFHIIHHSLAAIVPAQVMPLGEPILRWFAGVNFLVHAIAYPLLALQAIQIRVPKSGMIILGLELFQMIFAIVISTITLVIIYNGGHCVRHPWSLTICNYMYLGFFVLVIHLCYQKFIAKKQQKPKSA